MSPPLPIVTVLDHDECLALLTQVAVGRVAVSMRGLPAVRTVRFALADENVVFRVGPDSNLRRAVTGHVVAFQTDHYDASSDEGWSVHVQGFGQDITDQTWLAAFQRLPLPPWASDHLDRFMALSTEMVTGERVRWPSATVVPINWPTTK